MKYHNPVRDAIDESLCGVRFGAQDTRSVLRIVRKQPAKPSRAARKRGRRLDLVFAAAMLVLVVAPISLFALRAHHAQPVPVASAGDPIAAPSETFTPPSATFAHSAHPDVQSTPIPHIISEQEAVRIARECFEAHCDTSIYTFEEYAVQTALRQNAEGYAQYTVRLESIYDNGCSFIVVISAEDGKVIQYSTPSLATQTAK